MTCKMLQAKVPVRSSDTRLFAADLPGSEFGASGKTITVMYNSLTFGWTGAPGEYMMFAWVAKLAHAADAPKMGCGMTRSASSHWS